ncbi:ATP-binding protein [Tsuneonella sp. YG55]|uniref:ATP-binding protein n=1 Tax=Tsuneonella litorea TaxID=2976475 RepID=A0A9X3ALN2_9SPHN|nr:ATP-binding protein [Tsuneonella litorea]MCT2560029.1 ATP-binding protein [Tsuneonella litorea]
MIRVCFHGAEGTGKSTLAGVLAKEWGCPLVPEYGRTHAETAGTDFTMDHLLAIAREQDRLMQCARAGAPPLVLLDTDPLMTAAWAQMLFGQIPGELLAYDKAELYLLFAPDVPWVYDGTRFFGLHEARRQFSDVAEDLLRRTGVRYETIGGDWQAREAAARAAIAAALG